MATISPNTLQCPSEPHSGQNSYLKLIITGISQTDGGTNQTTVNWEIRMYNAWSTLHRAYCSLGNKVLYDAKPVKSSWSSGALLDSGTATFDNNSDGTLVLTAYLKQMFYYGNGVESRWTNPSIYQDASTNMTCSTIPRYFSSTPSMTIASKTETQIVYNWSTSETCDNISISGSGTKTIIGLPGTSGTITITGLSANTSYSHTGTFRRKDSQLTSNSAQQTNSTYQYPYVSGVGSNPLTIGNSQTLTLYNPLGRSCTVYMKQNSTSGTQLYSGTTSGTSITFTPTANTLYASIPTAQSGTAVYYCTYSSQTVTTQSGTYQVRGTEGPTFGSDKLINFVDTLHVNDITGNSSKFIKGHNILQGTIKPMTFNNSANSTNARYIVAATGSPSSQELSYSSSNKNFNVSNLTANLIAITAYDSRGLPTATSKTIDLVDYTNPKVNSLTVTRQNGIGTYATIECGGTYTCFNWTNIVNHNSIQHVYYRQKLSTSSTWGSWIDITSSLTQNNNGQWTLTKTLDVVFTNTAKYDFQVYVQDLLESSDVQATQLSTANALIWRDLNNKRIGINKKPDYTFDVDGNINATKIYKNGVEIGGSGSYTDLSNKPQINSVELTGNKTLNDIGVPPKSHAASGTTYGVGTSSNYGHCRVINNLTTSSATNGYALQAYQGKVLKDSIDTINAKISSQQLLNCCACYRFSSGSSTEYSDGSYIPFMTKVFNSFKDQYGLDYFVPESSGLITINYTGYIKLSLNLWFWSSNTGARPWIQIYDYNAGKVIAHYICSNYNGYQSVSIPEFIFSNISGHKIGVRIYISAGSKFGINSGCGDDLATYITLSIV